MSEEARMKKTIIKIAVCVVVFIASAFIIGGIMNQGHNNMTMEMAPATLPVITMESGGVACNELHGNTVEMDVAYQKDTVTMLGAGRQANFTVDTYGREITGISMEVRSIDGSRLIENGEVTGWKAGGKVSGHADFKRPDRYQYTVQPDPDPGIGRGTEGLLLYDDSVERRPAYRRDPGVRIGFPWETV